MKSVEEVIINFEQSFDNSYVETWKTALKNQTRLDRYYVLTSKNEVEIHTNKTSYGTIILCLYFEPFEFREEKINLSNLVNYLTDEDKTKYIQICNRFFDNDDYIFYNLNEVMIKWIKNNAMYALEQYVESVILARRDFFKKSKAWTNALQLVEETSKENVEKSKKKKTLNSVYGKRDIVKELTKEYSELGDKITKLDIFITSNEFFKTLPTTEQIAMKIQLDFMKKYYEILIHRVRLINSRLNPSEDEKDASSK